MQARGQAAEFLETENKRAPFVGIDAVIVPVHQDGGIGVHALNADLDGADAAALHRVVIRDAEPRLRTWVRGWPFHPD